MKHIRRVKARKLTSELVYFFVEPDLPVTVVKNAISNFTSVYHQAMEVHAVKGIVPKECINHSFIRRKFRLRDLAPFQFPVGKVRQSRLKNRRPCVLPFARRNDNAAEQQIPVTRLAAFIDVYLGNGRSGDVLHG